MEYLVIGENTWSVQPDFEDAYKAWKYRAPRRGSKTEITIYQIDTTNLEFAAGTAPVWVDYLGYINWTWKDSFQDRDNVVVAKAVYSGLLSKAPRSNMTLAKLIFGTQTKPVILKRWQLTNG